LEVEKCQADGCEFLGVTRVKGDKRHCCLETGDLILLSDLERCPKEVQLNDEETITKEEIWEISQTLRHAEEILEKVSQTITELTKRFDDEDLVALIWGRNSGSIRKGDIRNVIAAINRAKTVSKRDALKKFIASLGHNTRIKDVNKVIEEIERLNRKYGGGEQ